MGQRAKISEIVDIQYDYNDEGEIDVVFIVDDVDDWSMFEEFLPEEPGDTNH